MSPRGADFDPITLITRLTERDLTVIDLLARHKIATTAILRAVVGFPSRRAANLRLRALCDLGLLRRFRLPATGTLRFVLDWHGQVIWAIRQGQRTPTRRDADLSIQHIIFSAHRTHKEGVNEFFALLHEGARAAGDVRITEWLNEAEAAGTGLLGVRPDAAGTLTWDDGRELRFWYEHDRGTETLARLVETVDRYRTGRLALARSRTLLIGVPGARRLDHFLTAAPVPADLTVAVHVTVPLPPISHEDAALIPQIDQPHWRVLGDDEPRSLHALADRPTP